MMTALIMPTLCTIIMLPISASLPPLPKGCFFRSEGILSQPPDTRMPPYGKNKSLRICHFFQQGRCDKRNCPFSHGDGGAAAGQANNKGGRGGGAAASSAMHAPTTTAPKANNILVTLLRLLFQKEQFAIYNAEEGRLNLSNFKACPDVAAVQDSIDFNTAAFCEALCETIQSCIGNSLTILQLDCNNIRSFKHLSSSLVTHNLHTSIVSLSIAHNEIGTFDVLTQLKGFTSLRELVLEGNPVANDPKALNRVRHALPNLLGYNRASVVRPPLSLPWPIPGGDPSIVRTPDEQSLIQYLDERFFQRLNSGPAPEGGVGQFGANQMGGGSSVVDMLSELYHPRAVFTLSFADSNHAAAVPAGNQNRDATRDVNQLRQKQTENNHNICKGIKQTAIVKGKIEVLAKMSNVLYPNKHFYFAHTFSSTIHTSFISGNAMSGGVGIATATVHGVIRYQHKVHDSFRFERTFHRSLVLAQENGAWLITNDAVELRPMAEDPIFISFSADRSSKVARKIISQLGASCGNGMGVDVAQAAALVCTSDAMWLDVLMEVGALDVSVLQECMTLTGGDARSAIYAARVVARSFIAARQAGNNGGGMAPAEALQRLQDSEWNVEAVMPL